MAGSQAASYIRGGSLNRTPVEPGSFRKKKFQLIFETVLQLILTAPVVFRKERSRMQRLTALGSSHRFLEAWHLLVNCFFRRFSNKETFKFRATVTCWAEMTYEYIYFYHTGKYCYQGVDSMFALK